MKTVTTKFTFDSSQHLLPCSLASHIISKIINERLWLIYFPFFTGFSGQWTDSGGGCWEGQPAEGETRGHAGWRESRGSGGLWSGGLCNATSCIELHYIILLCCVLCCVLHCSALCYIEICFNLFSRTCWSVLYIMVLLCNVSKST